MTTIRANRNITPTPLAVGDRVVLGFGNAPGTWIVTEIRPHDRVVLRNERHRKPEGGLTGSVRKELPWRELQRGRAERRNHVPIAEAIYA